MKSRLQNDAGVFGAKFGHYNGRMYTFTHRNPATGELWGEDITAGKKTLGKWVPAEKVKLCE